MRQDHLTTNCDGTVRPTPPQSTTVTLAVDGMAEPKFSTDLAEFDPLVPSRPNLREVSSSGIGPVPSHNGPA